jgi:hypothetical protein
MVFNYKKLVSIFELGGEHWALSNGSILTSITQNKQILWPTFSIYIHKN